MKTTFVQFIQRHRKRWPWIIAGLVVLAWLLPRCTFPLLIPPKGKIAFASDREGRSIIYTMNADGANQTALTEELESSGGAEWSPDGRYIAFWAEHEGKDGLWVMEADGSNKIKVFDGSLFGPRYWSPDSTHIAFVSSNLGERGFEHHTYIVNRDGTGLVNVNPDDEGDFSWSPDGMRLAFESERDGNREIYVVNRDGSGLTNLTKHPAHDGGFSWSPDGVRLAFESERDGNWEIYVVNRDGSGLTRLTDQPTWDKFPRWSPDSDRIAFFSDRDNRSGIYIMNSDGTNLRWLGEGWYPQWSPDGRRIATGVRNGLRVIPLDGSRPVWIGDPLGCSLDGPTWSPDGRRLMASARSFFPPQTDVTGPWDFLFLLSSNGLGRKNLGRYVVSAYSWSPDGRYLAFSRGTTVERKDIFVRSANGWFEFRLTRNDWYDGSPAWQPQVQ